jgi:hypothetical protein
VSSVTKSCPNCNKEWTLLTRQPATPGGPACNVTLNGRLALTCTRCGRSRVEGDDAVFEPGAGLLDRLYGRAVALGPGIHQCGD